MTTSYSTLDGREAQEVIRIFLLAAHATMRHGPAEIEATEDGEWLVTCCSPYCPVHFEVILRERPPRPPTGSELFVNVFACLCDPEALIELCTNGFEIRTAAFSAQVMVSEPGQHQE